MALLNCPPLIFATAINSPLLKFPIPLSSSLDLHPLAANRVPQKLFDPGSNAYAFEALGNSVISN